ncbi:CBS domain-containing protein [Bacteriovorax sp. PP10]|uniref:CBS domain-containing protein n=1 Tax=Bacteriovorax antarcticus TaxID=3088717 RepID=A0ABU5VY47_9BACT|nr:CBS domain-containing protein [Bacteriovorax sp. PP10]MEA9357239.1 CBS domain-containing protein [Bacteriovorax sp. PP10]
MIVKDCMTKSVELVTPDMNVAAAAKKMRDGDFGLLPVQKNDRLVGMLTDRDIAIRCVAEGRDCKSIHVGEIMTDKVLYCFEDQNLNEVIENLGDNQIRRLPVLNRDKRLVGILSLGDLTHSRDLNPSQIKGAMDKICKPNFRK